MAIRARSAAEVRRALRRRGVPAAAADETLVILTRRGYLDDAAFAAAYAESRGVDRRLGPRRVAADLGSRGVSREVTEAAVRAAFGPGAERRLAEAAAVRKWPGLARHPRPVALRRLAAHLSRQGFSTEVVAAILRERSGAGEVEPH
ncbi:MAG: RecX family transcriptional regulator [candidate division NC10 bacterium]|nr:RecX family transcriptional regulator [candidate division NC10 bacterium]